MLTFLLSVKRLLEQYVLLNLYTNKIQIEILIIITN